jgi:hypothetical protein
MSTLPAAIATIPSATRIPVAQSSQMSCLVRMMPPVVLTFRARASARPDPRYVNDNHSHLKVQGIFGRGAVCGGGVGMLQGEM